MDTDKNTEKILTFEDYAIPWITTIIPNTCKESTNNDYQTVLKEHILPVFGKAPVDSINRFTIKKYLMDKLSSGLSLSRVKHIKVAMSGVFNLALDDGVGSQSFGFFDHAIEGLFA